MENLFFPLHWSLFLSRSYNCLWLIRVRWKKWTNPQQWRASQWLCSPLLPAKMGGASGYIIRCLPPHLRFLRRKQSSMQLIARPGAQYSFPYLREPRSRIVTEYVPFRYFTRTASGYRRKYGNQSNHAVLWRGTTRNQDLRGIRPRGVNRIHQAQGEPRGSSVA